jgi:nucleotide-binding universal stress UspA family protein
MFRRLLVAYDDSSHAQAALAEAIDLARAVNGRLTIIAVAPEPSLSGIGGEYWAPVNADDRSAQIERVYEAMLERAADSVPVGVPVTTTLAYGVPASAIIEEARRGHDLLVMGSRGRGELSSLLLGSVSRHVLQASAIPVLVIHVPPSPGSADDRPSPPAAETNATRRRAPKTSHV